MEKQGFWDEEQEKGLRKQYFDRILEEMDKFCVGAWVVYVCVHGKHSQTEMSVSVSVSWRKWTSFVLVPGLCMCVCMEKHSQTEMSVSVSVSVCVLSLDACVCVLPYQLDARLI